MRGFFQAFYRSFGNAPWLKEQRYSLKRAIGYFVLLVGLSTLLVALPIAISLPGLKQQTKTLIEQTVPAAFRATTQNGKLTITGIDQPLIYKNADENVVMVVNTLTTSTLFLDNFLKEYGVENGVLITQEKMELFTKESWGSGEYYWKDLQNFSIDKTTMLGWLQMFSLPLLMVVMIILFYIGFFVSKVLIIFIGVALVFLISSIVGKTWRFKHLFTIGLYGITLPTFIALLLTTFSITIPYVQFLAFLAFMLAMVFTKDSSVDGVETRLDS